MPVSQIIRFPGEIVIGSLEDFVHLRNAVVKRKVGHDPAST